VVHRSAAELEAGLEEIRRSPAQEGTVELIVRRPAEDEREVLDEGVLDLDEGLVGDVWQGPDPGNQLTLMNARVVALLAGDPGRRALAGDQLYVDLDLSAENLSAGARLALGSAVIEVTALPHTGCGKFSARFGGDAARFVNSAEGRALRLRGVNAKVVQPGVVRRGDSIRKV
jgi:MOSC domain-containing protein YiiM